MKKIISILALLSLFGCQKKTVEKVKTDIVEANVTFDNNDIKEQYDSEVVINFSDSKITIGGKTVSGNKVTIDTGGTYIIEGKSTNASIYVEAPKQDIILVLNNVDITNLSGPAIAIISSSKTIINLKEETTNYLIDGVTYEDDAFNSCLYSKSDLTINGKGKLIVDANYYNGIDCSDSLKIVDASIVINALKNGIKGNDLVATRNANLDITSLNDGIKSDDVSVGTVFMTGGKTDISSYGDCIVSSIATTIESGEYNLISGINNESLVSCKGISSNDLSIYGGELTIDSRDDAFHAYNNLLVNGGTITASSKDDAFHANETLIINEGVINIISSYEGLEGNNIIINGGKIKINASDDGVNVANGNDGSGAVNGPVSDVTSGTLYVNGGYLVVNANGDGLDSNGSIEISGGMVIVNGPTNNANGALDYNLKCEITGGTLIACGSTGMAQGISSSSNQCGVLINFTSNYNANTIFRIEDINNNEIITFAPCKKYQSILISTPNLVEGEYRVLVNCQATNYQDGLCNNYISGTIYRTFSISSISTKIGNTMGGRI